MGHRLAGDLPELCSYLKNKIIDRRLAAQVRVMFRNPKESL